MRLEEELRHKDTVLIVSNCYLKPIMDHSRFYTFNIMGYPNFKDALLGFSNKLLSNYLGIIISVEKFTNDELSDLYTMLSRIALLDTDLPVIISHNHKEKIDRMKSILYERNMVVNITDICTDNVNLDMSDVYINKNLYLPIIKSRRRLYKTRNMNPNINYDTLFLTRGRDGIVRRETRYMHDEDFEDERPVVLEYSPLISELFGKVLDDISVKPNINRTILLDKNLADLEDNLLYYNIRMMMVYILHNEDISSIEDSIVKEVDKSNNKIRLKSLYIAAKKKAKMRRLELDKLDAL